MVLFHFTDADPAGTASDYTATVVWGDGTTETSRGNPTKVQVVGNDGGFDVVGSHASTTTLANATFSVSVADPGATLVGGSKSQFKRRHFDADGVTYPSPEVTEGGAVIDMVLIHFTDSDAIDTVVDFRASVNWGDGTRETNALIRPMDT